MLITQAPDSRICGQCVVAMAAGVPLAESFRAFGHRHSTRARELAAVLCSLGFRCGDRLVRISADRPLPHTCVVKILWPDRRGSHWILLWRGEVFDSCGDAWRRMHWSSFLELVPPARPPAVRAGRAPERARVE